MKKLKQIEPGDYDGIVVKAGWGNLAKKLQPMDFFCTQGAGFLGWGIRSITKNMSPDRECEFNHAGLFPNGNINTLEALWKVESTNFAEHYEGCKVLVGRFKEMTIEKAALAFDKISEHVGQSYPTRRILLHLLNMAHYIHWINAVVCSELVAKALFYAGARDHKWWGVTPDNLADEIEHELNHERTGPKYKIIMKGQMSWLDYRYCSHCKQLNFAPLESKTCYICGQKYSGIERIPNQMLRSKATKYNEQKIEYIHEQIKK